MCVCVWGRGGESDRHRLRMPTKEAEACGRMRGSDRADGELRFIIPTNMSSRPNE